MPLEKVKRCLLSSVFLGTILLAQTPAPRAEPRAALPFAPALYSLRATYSQGSALVWLDADGKETVIHQDSRTASDSSPFSGAAHATHFGPFSCTPDGSKVVYTLFGKAKKPESGGVGVMFPGPNLAANIYTSYGVGFSASSNYGERSFEGFYAWDRATQKSERLWDFRTLSELGKKWQLMVDVSPKYFHEDVVLNAPCYLFHLKEQKFLWITAGWFLLVDLADRSIKPIDGCMKDVTGTIADTSIHAWQEPDGTVRAFRRFQAFRISPEGRSLREPLEEKSWHVYLADGNRGFFLSDGGSIKCIQRDTAGALKEKAVLKCPHDELRMLPVSGGLLNYSHKTLGADELQRLGEKGEVLWTANLGNCKPGLFFTEKQGKLLALLRRTSKPEGVHRLTLDLETGKVDKDEPWEAYEDYGRLAVPQMEQIAYCIPAPQGTLAWIPSSGAVKEKFPQAAWTPLETKETLRKAGVWMWIDGELRTKVLMGRPLADEMLVIHQGRPTPLNMWANSGMVYRGFFVSPPSEQIWDERLRSFPTGFLHRLVPSHLSDFASRWLESQPPIAPAAK